ncbi:hypothetical protein GGD65_007837 [Bradyrhizobium sp. CIR18]|uniref:hypothetical protein n=1 Tax=Bradyrhizobium sp. CIR18 TaxID=2663839 RepID=UPI0016069C37|nr:hypothetical protein [Bradyrhizobium sp. CIR18]MBB4366763.1 hypothetical protein [Bradyrhizobium sp. CIR18]
MPNQIDRSKMYGVARPDAVSLVGPSRVMPAEKSGDFHVTEQRINLHMPYYQPYRLYRCRKELGVHLAENVIIIVREIDPSEAPNAYRIHAGAECFDDYPEQLHVVRSFEGSCWWPLMTDDGPVSVLQFIEFAAEGELGSFVAFDDQTRLAQRSGPLDPPRTNSAIVANFPAPLGWARSTPKSSGWRTPTRKSICGRASKPFWISTSPNARRASVHGLSSRKSSVL